MHRFASVCPSVCDWTEIHWTIIHISKTVAVRGMKFGQNMHVSNPKDDLDGQGHRSKVRFTRSKNVIFVSHFAALQVMFEVKGHIGQGHVCQGERSHGEGQQKGHDIGRWAHINVKLHFLIFFSDILLKKLGVFIYQIGRISI